MPNNFIVTMPTDNGISKTLRLADTVEFTGITFGSANLYPLLFNYLFSSYGYGLELNDYQVGEWTTWNIRTTEGDEPMTMSKGFLKQLDNGHQWWQVVLNEANEEDDTYTAEVLFSADRSSVLRYREQIGNGDIQKKPVSKGWYSQPTQLTEESREAATKNENIQVTIAKGTFAADLIEFGIAPEMTFSMWQAKSEDIPGGVLKYETKSEEELMYNSELQDYGTGATTKLESY
jgi:hypothetical protein